MRCLGTTGGWMIRLDRGEEILAELRAFVRSERIGGATLSGLGAVDAITVAFYDVAARAYRNQSRSGVIEILNLTGNVAWAGGDPAVHVHVAAAHETEGAFGGHLVSGRVSATVEIRLDVLEGGLRRAFEDAVGLPLLDLPPRRRD
jgi:predicted DNA-binding protein with PD1-like motif